MAHAPPKPPLDRTSAKVVLVPSRTKPGRIAERSGAGGNVPCDDAARTDHSVIADRHAGQDDGAAADPDIPTDRDRPTEFPAGGSGRCVAWMIGGVDLHCRPIECCRRWQRARHPE